MALGFTLSVVALLSLGAVAAVPREDLGVKVDRAKGRAFKGASITTSILAGSDRRKGPVQVDLVAAPGGVEAKLEGEGQERLIISTSKFAGVYRGLKVRVGVSDPLGIFVRSRTHELDFALEFLPTFLLSGNEPIMVAAAMLGDLPAGRSGSGQEFYSAEVYTTSSSSKDIMWKREAKNPSDRLFVRVGEANIPENLTVCFIEKLGAKERGTPVWMDLASEAMARIGLQVVRTGTVFRILHILDREARVSEARDAADLASIIMGLWQGGAGKETALEGTRESDILIVGEAETRDPETMALVLEKPSVVLSWGKRSPVTGTNVAIFTGREDISGLIAMVLGR